MIGNNRIGNSFRPLLRYAMQEEKRPIIVSGNMAGETADDLAQEMHVIADRSASTRRSLHISLSASEEDEKLLSANPDSEDLWSIIADEYIEAMHLEDHQYVAIVHRDTPHPHIHLIVNRVGFDGGLASDSQDYKRSMAACREIEQRHGLRPVEASQASKRVTREELAMAQRTGEPSVRQRIQAAADRAMKESQSMGEYALLLAASGIHLLPTYQQGGKISGLVYLEAKTGHKIKAAELGKRYMTKGLATRGIKCNPARDPEEISMSIAMYPQAEAESVDDSRSLARIEAPKTIREVKSAEMAIIPALAAAMEETVQLQAQATRAVTAVQTAVAQSPLPSTPRPPATPLAELTSIAAAARRSNHVKRQRPIRAAIQCVATTLVSIAARIDELACHVDAVLTDNLARCLHESHGLLAGASHNNLATIADLQRAFTTTEQPGKRNARNLEVDAGLGGSLAAGLQQRRTRRRGSLIERAIGFAWRIAKDTNAAFKAVQQLAQEDHRDRDVATGSAALPRAANAAAADLLATSPPQPEIRPQAPRRSAPARIPATAIEERPVVAPPAPETRRKTDAPAQKVAPEAWTHPEPSQEVEEAPEEQEVSYPDPRRPREAKPDQDYGEEDQGVTM
jgi:hypothetical protein